MTLNWLPNPTDFRGELKAALQICDRAEGLEKLVGLAQQRLGFVDTIQLDRALTDIRVRCEERFLLASARRSRLIHRRPSLTGHSGRRLAATPSNRHPYGGLRAVSARSARHLVHPPSVRPACGRVFDRSPRRSRERAGRRHFGGT